MLVHLTKIILYICRWIIRVGATTQLRKARGSRPTARASARRLAAGAFARWRYSYLDGLLAQPHFFFRHPHLKVLETVSERAGCFGHSPSCKRQIPLYLYAPFALAPDAYMYANHVYFSPHIQDHPHLSIRFFVFFSGHALPILPA